MSNFGLIIFSLFVFGFILLFVLVRLKTEIDKYSIKMRFLPFMKRQVPWKEVKSAKVISYGFVGGWGIRLGTKYGTVYNVKGNEGLAIELSNGKKFLIGTQKTAELETLLKRINTEQTK